MRQTWLLREVAVVVVGLLPLSAGATDTYQYDELGNLKARTTSTGTHSYIYDEVNRLDQETGPTGARDYAYDPNGNRTTNGAGTTATYTANSDRLATLNGTSVSLDAAGNLTSDGTNTYTWDAAGRLKTVSRSNRLWATYFYDYKHRRSRKETTSRAPQGAQTVIYHYDQNDRLIGETLADGTPIKTYVWHDEGLAAILNHATTPPTLLSLEMDHLGTPRVARTADGKVVWRWDSDGYGTTLPNEDPDGNGIKTVINLRFPGQYYDVESGLHYNWHRYYSPKLGRYVQSDPIGIAGGINTYAYVAGNPISKIDPLGLTAIAFDPATGTLRVDPEVDGRPPYNMPASSGRPNCGCDASAKDKGHIPSGSYTLHTNQLSNPGRIGDMLRNMRADWGDWRAPLTPDAGTDTFDRSDFFLHGGSYPGSAGCIDVGGGVFGNSQTDQLLRDILSDPDGRVPVIVK